MRKRVGKGVGNGQVFELREGKGVGRRGAADLSTFQQRLWCAATLLVEFVFCARCVPGQCPVSARSVPAQCLERWGDVEV